jgi:hypothetical protein
MYMQVAEAQWLHVFFLTQKSRIRIPVAHNFPFFSLFFLLFFFSLHYDVLLYYYEHIITLLVL